MSEQKTHYVVCGYSEDIILDENDEYVTAAEHIEEIEQKLGMAAKNAEYRERILSERISLLEARINEAKEIYTGMEGFIPETAPEAYQKRALDQMWEALQEQGE